MRRNKWVHDGIFINPNTILKETMQFMDEFKEVNTQQTHVGNAANNNNEIKWKALHLGWYKAN
jgi:hypothetical protein